MSRAVVLVGVVLEHGVLVGWACFCWGRVRSINLDYISNLSRGPDQL